MAISPPDPPHDLILRRRLLVQLAVFLCLEAAFVSLAITCYLLPLPVSLSLSLTQTKAGFTVLAIIWQTIAIMNAQNIVTHGFSSEWYIRFKTKNTLVPGDTDLVSTITSGLLDRFRYFLSPGASLMYRMSFLSSWALLVLAGIAPGVVTIDEMPRYSPTTVNVTNFTVTGGDTDDPTLLNPIVRAGLVVDLELRQRSPFGFATRENVIVGWPNVTFSELNGDLRFESDVLTYNLSCWWEAPSFNTTIWQTTWYAGGYAWYPWSTPLDDLEFSGGLMTMYRFATDQNHPVPKDYPDPLHATSPVGLSGYIFFGRNSSITGTPSKIRTLNLDGLPTTYSPLGFNFTDVENATGFFNPPLATFLMCDPQFHILDGEILLSRSNNSISVLSMAPITDGSPKVGNISPDAANVVLGLSLMEALEVDDDSAEIHIGARAAQVFLNDSSLNFDWKSSTPFDIGILPLADIQRNLTVYLSSSAKAFSSYIRDYDKESPSRLFLVPVNGAAQGSVKVLVASRNLMISTIALLGFVSSLLLFIYFALRGWKFPAFKLRTLMEYGNLMAWKNEEMKFDSWIRPSADKPTTLLLILRLIGFCILETAFITLNFVCVTHPILIDIPFSSSEIKGGFTILFILWQALAIYLLSEAISFAFSSEWSIQRDKAKVIIPGKTDRVSRLTSGFDDRTRYFLTRDPSHTFRLAYLTSIVLAILNASAPGALSVSTVKQNIGIPVNVADLHLLNSSESDENENNLNFLTDRTFTLGMMEHHEDTVFKFDVQPNWIIGWPDASSITQEVAGNVQFPTDVVHFNHTCEWRVPQLQSKGKDTVWIVDGQEWELWGEPLPDPPYRGGILPMYRYLDEQPDAKTAYLFIGTNDSFPVSNDTNKQSIINLTHLPTLLHRSGLMINNSDSGRSRWISPLSTALLCDPQIQISGGIAQLSTTKQLTVVQSGLPKVGNLPLEAVLTIFTRSLIETLDILDETFDTWTTILSARAFLTNASMKYETFPRGVPVNGLPAIGRNLDSIFLSASKAFMDGLHVDSADQSKLTSEVTGVIGSGQVERLALVGDRLLGTMTVSLSIIVALFFTVLMHLIRRSPGAPFGLLHIMSDIPGEYSLGYEKPRFLSSFVDIKSK